ncbi:MAG TPA: hypothetical protein VGS28_00675 [Candidatus Saccharimonadales bacterium]|nr:hypothetical protein [Candidatus Saccharimonadales bacterium]
MSIMPGEGGDELGPDELAARGVAETVPDIYEDDPGALEALRAVPLGGASGVITAEGEQLPLPVGSERRRRRRIPGWVYPAVGGAAILVGAVVAIPVAAGSGGHHNSAVKHVATSARRTGAKPTDSAQPTHSAPHRHRRHVTGGTTTSALHPYGLTEPQSSTFASVRGAAYDMIRTGPGQISVIASDNGGQTPDLFASYLQTGDTVRWAQWREQNGIPYVQAYGKLACRGGAATITSMTRMSSTQAFSPVSVVAPNSPDCGGNVLKTPGLALNLALLAARQVIPGGPTQYFPSLQAYKLG